MRDSLEFPFEISISIRVEIKIKYLRDQAEEWWTKRQKEWDSEKSARQMLLKV